MSDVVYLRILREGFEAQTAEISELLEVKDILIKLSTTLKPELFKMPIPNPITPEEYKKAQGI